MGTSIYFEKYDYKRSDIMSNVKKPSTFSGPISKVFAGMEVVDGVKNVRKEFKNTENQYDAKLGVDMGSVKATKLANEELDAILKVAGIKNIKPRVVTEAIKRGVKDTVNNFDKGTSKNIKGTVNAIKKGNKKQAFKGALRSMPGVAINAGLVAGAGVGTTKLLDSMDKKKSDENKLAHKIIGATVATGVAATALSGGGVSQIAKTIKNTSKNSVLKHPVDQLSKNNKTFKQLKTVAKDISNNKDVKNVIKEVGGSTKNTVSNSNYYTKNSADKIENAAQKIVSSINKNLNNTNPKFKKDIPQTLKELAKQEQSNFVNRFMINNRNATVDDAMKAWKASSEKKVHNKASQMAVSVAKRINKTASEELDDIVKLAGFNSNEAKAVLGKVGKGAIGAGKYVGDKMITPALTAMSTTAAPVIATTLLSQRMMNDAKKREESNSNQNNTSSETNPQVLVIRVDNGNAVPEKVAEEDTIVSDIGETLVDTVKSLGDVTGAEKLKYDRVHVGNGQKKLFRMHQLQGSEGMLP